MAQLNEIEKTRAILKAAGLKPKDYLGQNFLVDQEVLDEIVAAGRLKKSDTVLEVGPGLGVLTDELVKRVKRVVAVEKDPRLFALLQNGFYERKNVEFFNEDILKFYIKQRIPGKYKVVANIPYYLTSKLVSLLLEQDRRPELIVLMIQKEVAERIVAKAGELSILALSVNFFAEPEIVRIVPRKCFWPEPEVDSAIIRIEPKPELPEVDKKQFFKILHLAFAGKRKQIHNTLGKSLGIDKERMDQILSGLNLDSTVRPQQLSLAQWLHLVTLLNQETRKK